MNRREARELAMTFIFQMEAQKDFTRQAVDKFTEERDMGSQRDYVTSLLCRVVSLKEDIDKAIIQNSQGWTVERMAKTDLAVLRLAVAEILYMEQVPKAVAINEAVELAKLYGQERSPKFVNAVLKNIGPCEM